MSRRAYQTSRLVIAAKLVMASRYDWAAITTALRAVLAGNSRARAAISKLAARRFTSHSNGTVAGLVEVVDVEDELAVGRREPTEVRQVGISAALHAESAVGHRRQVGGHHDRGAAVERERRREHALVPDRDELGDTGHFLTAEERDGIGPIGRRLPCRVAGPRDLRARGFPARRRARRRRGARSAPALPRPSCSSWDLSAPGSRFLRILDFGEQRTLRRS